MVHILYGYIHTSARRFQLFGISIASHKQTNKYEKLQQWKGIVIAFVFCFLGVQFFVLSLCFDLSSAIASIHLILSCKKLLQQINIIVTHACALCFSTRLSPFNPSPYHHHKNHHFLLFNSSRSTISISLWLGNKTLYIRSMTDMRIKWMSVNHQ